MKNKIIDFLNKKQFYEALELYHKNRIKDFSINDQVLIFQVIDSSISDLNKLNQMIKHMCKMLEISYIINKKNEIIKYYDNTT